MTALDLTQLRLSDGVKDQGQLREDVAKLVASGWKIDEAKMGLEAAIKFPNYTKLVDFLSPVHVQSKIHNHHAEVYFSYNFVYIHWTTHRPRGLSDKDVALAQICHDLIVSLKGAYEEDVKGWRRECVACE